MKIRSEASSRSDLSTDTTQAHPRLHEWLLAVSASLATALALLPFHRQVAPANVALLMVLVVAWSAARLGRGPAVLASLVSVLIFDLGFVPPRGRLSVDDAEYLIMFAVMLAVTLLVSHFSGGLRTQTLHARRNERRQLALYEFAAALNGSLRREQIAEHAEQFVVRHYSGLARVYVPAVGGGLRALLDVDGNALDAALLAVHESGLASRLRDGEADRPWRYMQPLRGATCSRGVLELRLPGLTDVDTLARRQVIELVADLVAAALERLHYVQAAARSQAEIDAERLRNLLLTTLSHDLRTPLTVIYGLADSLRERVQDGDPALHQTALALCDEIMRMSQLGDSLLDLARLRTSPGRLCREWVSLEELVGAALHGMRAVPGIAQVSTQIDANLPWLRLDALLFERVLVNLIGNAIKHGGPAQRIQILADASATSIVLRVANSGSRFAGNLCGRYRPPSKPGEGQSGKHSGLGLDICAAVIAAHGGSMVLGNSALGAELRIDLALPQSPMPEPPDETGTEESP
ncbi:MAG: DUF4118 domain-containing protein [Lysobacterales bacterium]